MNEGWNETVFSLKNGTKRWFCLSCRGLQWKSLSFHPCLLLLHFLLHPEWLEWYLGGYQFPKSITSLVFFISPITSAREDEGWGWGKNEKWVSSGVGVAYGICPNQCHGPVSFGSLFHSASYEHWIELSNISLLKHHLLLASRTPDFCSLVLPLLHWTAKCWRAQGHSPEPLLYTYTPLGGHI